MGKSLLPKPVAKVLFSVLTLLTLTSQAALAEQCHVQLHNNSSFKIREVRMSHVGQDDWGENLVDDIEDKTVWQGQAVNLRFEDEENQCDYNMKIIGEDDREQEHRVNLCNNSDYEVTDE
jgi:hypothetical protein